MDGPRTSSVSIVNLWIVTNAQKKRLTASKGGFLSLWALCTMASRNSCGRRPKVNTSQMVTPKDHTSLACEKRKFSKHSGAYLKTKREKESETCPSTTKIQYQIESSHMDKLNTVMLILSHIIYKIIVHETRNIAIQYFIKATELVSVVYNTS